MKMDQEDTRNLNEPAENETADVTSETPVTSSTGTGKIERRDLLKALAGIPIVGTLFWKAFRKKGLDDFRRNEILSELGDLGGAPAVIPEMRHAAGDKIRLGIIGCGGEGNWLTHCAGFAHKWRIDQCR
jgi:hypothetical protein